MEERRGPSDTQAQYEAFALAYPANVLGYAFIGFIIEMMSTGVIISQFTYWYFATRGTDSWWMGIFMYSLNGISVAQLGLTSAWMWEVFVSAAAAAGGGGGGGGGVIAVFSTKWALALTVITLVPIVLVEMFYLHRAYKLWDEAKWVVYIVAPFLTATVALSIWDYTNHDWNLIGFTSGYVFRAYLVATIITDTMLTILIAIPLWRARTGFKGIDQITMRLIIFTSECQIMPTLSLIGLLTKALVQPWSFSNLLYLSGGNLWTTTAMIVVNARAGMRREMENELLRQQIALGDEAESRPGAFQARQSDPLIFTPDEKAREGSRTGSAAQSLVGLPFLPTPIDLEEQPYSPYGNAVAQLSKGAAAVEV